MSALVLVALFLQMPGHAQQHKGDEAMLTYLRGQSVVPIFHGWLQNPDGSLTVERWPKGAKDQIVVPPYPGGRRGGLPIVATFHTHPNLGPDYQQEPSLTDTRAVRDDPDLKCAQYQGEFVISKADIYLIRPDGTVATVGDTSALLNLANPNPNS